jgi:hypothetical protein
LAFQLGRRSRDGSFSPGKHRADESANRRIQRGARSLAGNAAITVSFVNIFGADGVFSCLPGRLRRKLASVSWIHAANSGGVVRVR